MALAEILELKNLADRLEVAVDDEETRNPVVEARPIESVGTSDLADCVRSRSDEPPGEALEDAVDELQGR